MTNSNGDNFTPIDPLTPASSLAGAAADPTLPERLQETGRKVSAAAAETWEQTKDKASLARARTEFYVRENPVPTIVGALVVGLAIGLAIRFASSSEERKEVEVKSPLKDVDLSALTLPFLWPFFKSVKRKYDDSADAVKDGVDKLRSVDVEKYVKPLRKKWRNAW